MGLSSLRCHKNRHNFVDTPSNICLCNQGIEDTIRLFFLCPFYATVRATLAINVIAILQKYNLTHLGNKSHLYLYGQHAINFANNRKILLSTIEYIKKTRRCLTQLYSSTPFPQLLFPSITFYFTLSCFICM